MIIMSNMTILEEYRRDQLKIKTDTDHVALTPYHMAPTIAMT